MIRITLAALTILFLTTTSSFSQQKFAHLNRAELLQQMPEFDKANESLKKYQTELENQIQNLLDEYQSKLQKYQSSVNTMSEAVRNDKERELSQLEQRIQKFKQEAEDELSKKQDELVMPIIEKVDKAVAEVAKEKGYSYVFDTSAGPGNTKQTILYAEDANDIMALVKKKLGL